MTDVTPTFERPALAITLSTGERIKMTYGLEMDLRRMLPDPAIAIQLALNDPFTQDYVVRRCLTKINKMIEDPKTELIAEVNEDLTVDDTEKMVMWAVEHVLYFFAKRAAAMTEMGNRFQVVLPSQSPLGSTNSPSTTPSVGPTD